MAHMESHSWIKNDIGFWRLSVILHFSKVLNPYNLFSSTGTFSVYIDHCSF